MSDKAIRLKELIIQAKEILIGNDLGKFTIPSGQLYPHMWAWDMHFAAMGWAHIDIKRAQEEVEYLLSKAWDNGMIPHITFDQIISKSIFPDLMFGEIKRAQQFTTTCFGSSFGIFIEKRC